MNRLILFAPVLVFVAIGLFFAYGLTRDPSRIPSELINQRLPSFHLAAVEGFDADLTTEAMTGEVALLNVFASWCVSCHIEHPLLMKLAQENAIPIYGLNWKDKPGDGAAWLARYGNPYALVGDDHNGRVALDLGVTGAPETFVIDKNGRVRYKFLGPITPEEWERTFLPLIEELRRS